jgi:hypothetical protein
MCFVWSNCNERESAFLSYSNDMLLPMPMSSTFPSCLLDSNIIQLPHPSVLPILSTFSTIACVSYPPTASLRPTNLGRLLLQLLDLFLGVRPALVSIRLDLSHTLAHTHTALIALHIDCGITYSTLTLARQPLLPMPFALLLLLHMLVFQLRDFFCAALIVCT